MGGDARRKNLRDAIAATRQEAHEHSTWRVTIDCDTTGERYRAIRATTCTKQTNGTSTCKPCLSLMKTTHSFRSALDRYKRAQSKDPGTGEKNTRVWAGNRPAKAIALRELHKQNHHLRRDLARAKARMIRHGATILPVRNMYQAVTECLARNDKKGALCHLTRLSTPVSTADEGHTTEQKQQGQQETALAIAKYMLSPTRRGKQTESTVIDFAAYLRIIVGPAAYNFVRDNIKLPDQRTAERARPQGDPFGVGVTRKNFEIIRDIYKNIMATKGITGKIPCTLAEDETAINAVLRWDYKTDTVFGSCGKLCAEKCGTKGECKSKGCQDTHYCVYQTLNLSPVIGDDDNSYQRLAAYVGEQRPARMLRVIMVNPLVRGLPPLPLVVIGTCRTATHRDYLLPQWTMVRKLFREVFSEIGMVVHTHGSDGDPLRRREFLLRAHQEQGERYGSNATGFTHTGRVTTDPVTQEQHIELPGDDDHIHCIKKITNCGHHSARKLQLGPRKLACLETLKGFVDGIPESMHGIRKKDLDRHGYKAMDVPSALRLCSQKALSTIEEALTSPVGTMPPQPHLGGMKRFMEILRTYASLYLSRADTHATRVRNAATVVTYIRLWREWVRNTKDMTLDTNFLSRECAQDVILSCHQILLLLKLFRDKYPHLECPFDRCGTDCCEDLFSALGSFVDNKHTYSVYDAIQTLRAKLDLERIKAHGNLNFKERKRHRTACFDDLPGVPHNPRQWLTDDELEAAWNEGVAIGYKMAQEDDMKPPAINLRLAPHNRRWARWWTHPHEFDPKAPAKGRDDQQELEGEEEHEGNHENANSSDDDDDEDNADDSDDSDDDNIPLAFMRAASVQAPAPKVSTMINTPGGRRHKMAALQQLAGSGTTVSADRGMRARAAHAASRETFDVATNDWVLGIGTDVAVQFEAGNNTCLGKIIAMRKRTKKEGDPDRRWVKYRKPVVMNGSSGERKDLGDLYVTCRFYKRTRAAIPKGKKRTTQYYKFNVADSTEYHVTMIICPLKMDYDPASDLYALDDKCQEVIAAAHRGEGTWDPN